MKISIIIPTHGRPGVFSQCLKSINLLKKELDKFKPYEIIIINNNNEKLRNETSKACREYDLPIKEIVMKKAAGSVRARNAGIKKAKGDVLIFFDDDTIILKNYFTNLMKHYKDKKVGAVGGSETKQKNTLLHKLFFKFHKPGSITWSGEIISNFSPDYNKPIIVKHLHGSNFSICKRVIDEIGLMDELMIGHYRDETEFIYRVYRKGYTIIFEPEAEVIHTESNIGGSISPSKKKEWAYWYHRNTSYFFFKQLYTGNPLQLIAYIARELITSIIRAIIYKNSYYLFEMKAVKEGHDLALKRISY